MNDEVGAAIKRIMNLPNPDTLTFDAMTEIVNLMKTIPTSELDRLPTSVKTSIQTFLEEWHRRKAATSNVTPQAVDTNDGNNQRPPEPVHTNPSVNDPASDDNAASASSGAPSSINANFKSMVKKLVGTHASPNIGSTTKFYLLLTKVEWVFIFERPLFVKISICQIDCLKLFLIHEVIF